MAKRTPQQSARLSRMAATYGTNRAASLLREKRASYRPQSKKAAIMAAWSSGKISWAQAQAMAQRDGFSL